MKMLLIGLLGLLISYGACAQAAKDKATQLAASFDKDKLKMKAKYGVEKQRALVTRHTVADVADLTFYSGRYVGIDGRYELTLNVGTNKQVQGQLLEPTSTEKTRRTPLTDITIQDGLFRAKKGSEIIEGVFVNQGRVDNDQETIAFGLGIVNPNLPDEGVSFTRIFCARK